VRAGHRASPPVARVTGYRCRVSELTRWVAARGHVRWHIEPSRRAAADAMMTTGTACARHATVIPCDRDGDHP